MNDPEHHIAGTMTGVIVRYVRNLLGERGVRELLVTAGESRGADELEDTTRWSSYRQGVALFEAAAAVTGRRDAARAIGEETLRQYAGTEVAGLLRSTGSPARLLESVAETAAKFSTVTRFGALEVQDSSALIAAQAVEGFGRHPTMCDYTAGLLSQVSPLFGLGPALVVERECQARGGSRCLYEVSWDPTTNDIANDAEGRADHLEAQLGAMSTRLESLYSTAAELLSGDDVATVLARITDRAGTSVRAPRYVLAVQLHGEDVPAVHHYGMTDAEAAAAAELLLTPARDEFPAGWLVADVASGRQHHGRLAAIHPGSTPFFPHERRLLDVYGSYAAAVLDMATALEESKRRDATARALLNLGQSLSTVATTTDVALRLVTAVPDVVACERALVLQWDPDAGEFRTVASCGFPSDIASMLEHLAVRATDSPVAAAMVESPAPLTLEPDCDDALIGELMRTTRSGSAAVVPLIAHGELYGVLCAARDEGHTWALARPDLLERLSGLAAQASTALTNARLLERARHEAWHDTLTDLPNRRYLETQAERAVNAAKRQSSHLAILFIDLDQFKRINDSLGHARGDQLLREVARRLEMTTRLEDTLARLSGDEFVLLAEHLDTPAQAKVIADRMHKALRDPFDLAGHRIQVTASIGIANLPANGASYQQLLRSADTAMYAAKARRPAYAS